MLPKLDEIIKIENLSYEFEKSIHIDIIRNGTLEKTDNRLGDDKTPLFEN